MRRHLWFGTLLLALDQVKMIRVSLENAQGRGFVVVGTKAELKNHVRDGLLIKSGEIYLAGPEATVEQSLLAGRGRSFVAPVAVQYPTRVEALASGVGVGPVKQPAPLVSFVLPPHGNDVATSQRDPLRQVDVVGHQEGPSVLQADDEPLVAGSLLVVGQGLLDPARDLHHEPRVLLLPGPLDALVRLSSYFMPQTFIITSVLIFLFH